jgi:xanthine dehydrogenase accessory factor
LNDVIEQVDAWMARGDRVALATVVAVRRSAPRPPGSKMAINDRGEVYGAVSGGCVEGAVVEVAGQVLAGGAPQLRSYGFSDDEAWGVGLPCGGEIDVWVERFDHEPFAAIARDGGRAAQVTAVRGPQAGARLLVRADGGREGGLGDPALDAEASVHAGELMWAERSELRGDLFVDVVAPPPRLLIFGAVEYASHLAHFARATGWRPYVIDPRSQFATRARFPDAIEVVVAWPEEALERLGGLDRATYVAVLTHDPKIDDDVLRLALAGDPAYIGAMGSRRAQAARRERLLDAGVDEADLQRISAPIGLDLGAIGAEEVALAIMAEAIAVRRGRDGGRLVERRGEWLGSR